MTGLESVALEDVAAARVTRCMLALRTATRYQLARLVARRGPDFPPTDLGAGLTTARTGAQPLTRNAVTCIFPVW